MCFFSGIMDVERQNGIKKWIVYSKRERLKVGKLDKILRIFCNSPGIASDELREWLIQVAKKWWSKADRDVDCDALDIMCNDDDEDIDIIL